MDITEEILQQFPRPFQMRCQKQGIIFVADPLKRNPLSLERLYQALRFNFQPIDPEMDRKRLAQTLLKGGKLGNDLTITVKESCHYYELRSLW